MARLKEMRLTPDVTVESFSTPRRLTARIGRMPERQEDLDETITGPPVSAAFNAAGEPTPAALGFAKKQGVPFESLERVKTDKGEYLAAKKHHRGKAHRRCPAGAARIAAPRSRVPQADALGRDAGGRQGRARLRASDPLAVVSLRRPRRPVHHRTHAECGRVAGPGGHDRRRDLRPSLPGDERPRRPVDQGADLRRVPRQAARTFRDPRSRRAARSDRARAGGQGAEAGRARPSRASRPNLVDEVADLVEFPGVVAGILRAQLPGAAARSADDHAGAPSALLPGPDRRRRAEGSVPGGRQHAAVGRAHHREERRARRHRAPARREVLLGGGPQDQARGSPRIACTRSSFTRRRAATGDKAERIEKLARTIAADVWGPRNTRTTRDSPPDSRRPISSPTWCSSSRSCRAQMGGIYAREQGLPEPVWKAIYHHYLPQSVEADAGPSRAQLGSAATSWAAVSVADKADTLHVTVQRRREADRVTRSIRAPSPERARVFCGARRSAGADRHRSGDGAGKCSPTDAGAGRRLRDGPSCSSACATCSSSAASMRATCARSPMATSRRSARLVARRKLEGATGVHVVGGLHAARDGVQARAQHRA